MERQVLVVTTTGDFLLKFERGDVKLLQSLGYTVHYAANFTEPPYCRDRREIEALGVRTHHIPIARSPLSLSGELAGVPPAADAHPGGGDHRHPLPHPGGGRAGKAGREVRPGPPAGGGLHRPRLPLFTGERPGATGCCTTRRSGSWPGTPTCFWW